MSADLEGWLDQAHSHAKAGRYAEALELHQRYHERSREVTSLFGVRLSFALSSWADLARRHPPAMVALRATRDAAADRLRAATQGYDAHSAHPVHADFAEVVAISTRLEDEQYSADLFAELDQGAPAVAADCWAAARSLLVRAQRFDLARRYLGEPERTVARAAAILDQRLTRGFARFSEHLRPQMREDTVNGYVADVRELLSILDGVGDHEQSAGTRQRAIDVVPWAHVRDDVAEALGTPAPPG
jgi:hypothetical protein